MRGKGRGFKDTVSHWVAIDDKDLVLCNRDATFGHFVQTNPQKGIGTQEAETAILTLMAGEPWVIEGREEPLARLGVVID